MKLLITGSGGMIGKNLLEHPQINSFDLLTPRREELDLLNFESTFNFFKKNNPDLVIHLAAKVGGIQANIENPIGFFVENIDIGRNVIMASYQAKIKKLINLGSSCMYPRDCSQTLKEEMILKGEFEPTNEGYALAKIVATRLCEYISNYSGFQYKTLIPCNIYGRHDKFNQKDSHLIAAIIEKIHKVKIKGASEVEIWGDGLARREFMYASDLADAIVHAVNNFETLPRLMNIGIGIDYSINEYYDIVAKVLGYTGSFSHNLEKPIGMMRKLNNIDTQKSWGWTAKHSLNEGIKKTYDFYLQGY